MLTTMTTGPSGAAAASQMNCPGFSVFGSVPIGSGAFAPQKGTPAAALQAESRSVRVAVSAPARIRVGWSLLGRRLPDAAPSASPLVPGARAQTGRRSLRVVKDDAQRESLA